METIKINSKQIVYAKAGRALQWASRTQATTALKQMREQGIAGTIYQSPLSRRFFVAVTD